MCKFFYIVMPAVVVTGGIGATFSIDRDHRPIARMGVSREPTKFAGPPRRPTVPAGPLGDIRVAERSRRAIRPAGDPEREDGLNYDGVLEGWEGGPSSPRPAEPMPPTDCRSIERAPKNTDPWTGPYAVHDQTIYLFKDAAGFGIGRMFIIRNDRGVQVASRDVDRVELVSLLTDDEPSVYVLDELATPPLARQAKRRPLDPFERLGLDAVRLGEELVWTRDAPTRMFGAIRARAECLHCHANANEGDLLGAFTYYLKVPVDHLSIR